MQARPEGPQLMRTAVGRTLVALALAAVCVAGVHAQPAAPAVAPAAAVDGAVKGPPAGFVAPADPKPGETNAERAKSQPGNNAPMWSAVRSSGTQPGVTSLPGAETGVLIQEFLQYPGSRFTTAGEAWRQVRNQWIIPYGGALLAFAAVVLGLFYWRRGPIGHAPNTGPAAIERFTPFERVVHWTVGITFVILTVSGIVMAFGKYMLLPIIGSTLFGWLTYALKNLHNFAGPVFGVSLLFLIAMLLKDNLPRAADITWLKGAGGMFGGEELPSHRFNGGEKILFWVGVCFFGLVVVVSGLVLNRLVPGIGLTRGEMQVAHMIHAVASVFMMAMLFGHMYMGSVGTRGALRAMQTGWVDEQWAREHHRLWYDDIKAGRLPARRSAEAPPAAATPAQV